MGADRDSVGRIVFPGNPWPGGHAVSEFQWSGRLTSSGEAWFDFHLQTVDYDAEAGPAIDDDDDWRSPIVWGNYHSCILSSTFWRGGLAPFDGEHTGVRIGTPDSPLRFADLDGRTICADAARPGDEHDDDQHRSFGIYLLGHDGVADHRITFVAAGVPDRFDVTWTGRIALVYAGDQVLRHTFRAQLHSVRFDGFVCPDDLDEHQVANLARNVLTDHTGFVFRRVEGRRMLVPRPAPR